MKILHIVITVPFTENLTYQENLLPEYQCKNGHEVIILTTCYEYDNSGTCVYSPPVDKMTGSGIRLIRRNYKRILNHFITIKIRRIKGLRNLLREHDPEIIFVHGPQTYELLTVADFVREKPETKLFIINHADNSNSAQNFLSRIFLHRIFYKYLIKKAEPVTSAFYGMFPARIDFMKKFYNVSDCICRLLPAGIDDETLSKLKKAKTRTLIRNKFNFSDKDFVVITGGKLDTAKLQTICLAEAIHNIKSDNVRLIIFGSVIKEIADDIKGVIDNKKVFSLGWLRYDEIYSHLLSSDLAIFPGRHSVLWETATGAGLPCLFKFWEGTCHLDLGGNCSFLYECSPREIKEKIEVLLNDRETYLKMKNVAEEKGGKIFSYSRISEDSLAGI